MFVAVIFLCPLALVAKGDRAAVMQAVAEPAHAGGGGAKSNGAGGAKSNNAGVAKSNSAGVNRKQRDRDALRSFPEVDRMVKGVAPILDKAARNHAEASVR